MPRSRRNYAVLALLTLGGGLATRPLRSAIGPVVAENIGDALWAALVYWLIAWGWRYQPSNRIALAAFAVAATVECSQLCHATGLETLRRTTLGGLVLGWGFAWGDFVAYAAGIILCFLAERHFRTKPGGQR